MNESPDSHRPRYHFAAPQGTWINDPVPFYDPRTKRYHVFLQHNPNAPVWGDMHWLHVSSADLLTWENHGYALTPSRTEGAPDFGGVWTGCITQRPSDGLYVALYTAIPTHKPFTQVQCAAVSSDLMTWEKVAENPLTGLSEKPDGYGSCFRDPQTFLGPDGKWYCVIGGEQLNGKGGAAFLYEATDDTLLHWKFRHVLYEGDAETGYDFECPDFFPLPGSDKWCLITSRHRSWWHVGTLDAETMRFTREAWGACDNELFYAAKSCVGPDGDRLLWGWIRESRSEAEQVAAGWSGVLSIPRRVTPSSEGGITLAPLNSAPLQDALEDGSVIESVTANGIVTSRRYV
jgi:beta-fructofuranosidase